MKIEKLILIPLIYLFCSHVIRAQEATQNADLILDKGAVAHGEIDAIYRDFSRAYRNLDAAAVAELYTDDALYLAPNSEMTRGREQILANFSSFFGTVKTSGGKATISFQILERRVANDFGYDAGIFSLSMTNAKGVSQINRGKFVVITRRMKNGKWRFALDVYNDLPRPQVNSNQNAAISAENLQTLLDPIFAAQMEKLHIPGAVVSIVRDGKIIFTKGYGAADVEKKTQVSPDKTLFRIGSITKVFTATAVLQMADQGKIKLTDDVNKYLTGVRVPDAFSKPVTFENLLTHTSGLDEITPGRHTSVESEIIPLGAFLKTRIVRQFAPGEIISYSTYNPALAAQTIEQITQQSFKVYLQKNIFEPLQMNHTSIAAVKDEYKNDLATGYEFADGKYQKLPFQWFNTYPASDINSTATDMARFMIANLNYGAIDGKRILSEKTAREMQQTHFRNHPKIPGWAYGFYEGEQNDLRFVEHGGSMDDGYSALLTLIPEKKVGIFVACNTEGGAYGLAGAVKNVFFNRYFPAAKKPEIPNTPNPAPDALKKFAGKYKQIIYCHTCAPNTAYVPDTDEVKITDDGMLDFGGGRWKQIEPLLFVLASGERAGQVLLGFKENKQGEIAFMFNDSYRVYERVN